MISASLVKKLLAAGLLLSAAGCDSIHWPHIWGPNEVPAELMTTPRLVETQEPEITHTESWPRLGDVPSKPTNFTPLPMIDATKAELDDDRQQTQEQKRVYEDSGAAAAAGKLP